MLTLSPLRLVQWQRSNSKLHYPALFHVRQLHFYHFHDLDQFQPPAHLRIPMQKQESKAGTVLLQTTFFHDLQSSNECLQILNSKAIAVGIRNVLNTLNIYGGFLREDQHFISQWTQSVLLSAPQQCYESPRYAPHELDKPPPDFFHLSKGHGDKHDNLADSKKSTTSSFIYTPDYKDSRPWPGAMSNAIDLCFFGLGTPLQIKVYDCIKICLSFPM